MEEELLTTEAEVDKALAEDETAPVETPKPVKVPEAIRLPTTEERMSKLEKKLDKMADVIGALADRVLAEPAKPAAVVQGSVEASLPPQTVAGMVPPKWRKIVDENLGADVDLLVDPSAGGDFLLKFLLPSYLDRRTGDMKQAGTRDLSVGLIQRASDENDVLVWSKKIAENIKKTYPNFEPKKA